MKQNEPSLDQQFVARTRRAVHRWFARAKRPLPWRAEPSPYRIWIAEIMAQQTRIETILPYYRRWLERFPDVATLANAPLDDVLRLWSGLGYYSRARNLHRAAQRIVETHDGLLPADPTTLQTLPGIGRYTAGAIASLAYGKPAPLVDGNVIRVIARLLDIAEDVTRPAVVERFWRIAAALVPSRNPGPFNEGLMELGALVCTPQSPACRRCPLQRDCLAYAHGVVEERPARPPKKNVPLVHIAAAVIQRADGAVLMVQNEYDRLFGGLWQLPQHPPDFTPAGAIGKRALTQALAAQLGQAVTVGKKIGRLDHLLSHRRLRIELYTAAMPDRPLSLQGYRAYRWLHERDAHDPAMASFTRKLLRMIAWQTPAGSG